MGCSSVHTMPSVVLILTIATISLVRCRMRPPDGTAPTDFALDSA